VWPSASIVAGGDVRKLLFCPSTPAALGDMFRGGRRWVPTINGRCSKVPYGKRGRERETEREKRAGSRWGANGRVRCSNDGDIDAGDDSTVRTSCVLMRNQISRWERARKKLGRPSASSYANSQSSMPCLPPARIVNLLPRVMKGKNAWLDRRMCSRGCTAADSRSGHGQGQTRSRSRSSDRSNARR
jgi:hypothetical protein